MGRPGGAERSLDFYVKYADFLLLHYPVLGMLKSVITVILVLKFFPEKRVPPDNPLPVAPWGSGQRDLFLLAMPLVTLGIWATDQVHGINAARIGMATALVLLVPQFGFVPPVFKSFVGVPMVPFVAGALTLGTVMNVIGPGASIAGQLVEFLPRIEANDLENCMSFSLLGIETSICATAPGMPAVLTPLAQELIDKIGFSLNAVLMIQGLGF
jgi:hypothetical protein